MGTGVFDSVVNKIPASGGNDFVNLEGPSGFVLISPDGLTSSTIILGTWEATTVEVQWGGTGKSSFTKNSVVCGGLTTNLDPLQSVDVSTAVVGDVLTYTGTSSIPTWQTPTGPSWVDETGTSVTMVVNTNYVADSASLVTFILPSSAPFGSTFQVTGKGTGGWKIGQSGSQVINFGNAPTTPGGAGYLASTNQFDSVTFVCVTTDDVFVVCGSQGNITVN